ncbi:MAG TPA: class I SAM-dependent methyltransferase [Pirellulales bacterium]|nr:class I SAM-dependent methyltransferase [Pirellulales bacterium]
MGTPYDAFAEHYRRSKEAPFRQHVEQYTLRKLAGPLRGESALDLACGEGFYSRLLKVWGAGTVVGVDLSPDMIELAARQESARPLGIRYHVQDVRAIDLGQQFDLVLAAFLFNHARNFDEFVEMVRAVVRHLAPGGRLVAVISRGDQPVSAYPKITKYGFSKSTPGELVEGAPITITFHVDLGDFSVVNTCLYQSTMVRGLTVAGLSQQTWQPPLVSPEGVDQFGEDYWKDFIEEPALLFLEARR